MRYSPSIKVITQELIEIMNDFSGFDIVTCDNRSRVVSDYRFIVYYLLKRYGITYEDIGKMFGKNHATIIHGVKKTMDMLRTDKKFISLYMDFVVFYKEKAQNLTEFTRRRMSDDLGAVKAPPIIKVINSYENMLNEEQVELFKKLAPINKKEILSVINFIVDNYNTDLVFKEKLNSLIKFTKNAR